MVVPVSESSLTIDLPHAHSVFFRNAMVGMSLVGILPARELGSHKGRRSNPIVSASVGPCKNGLPSPTVVEHRIA